METETEMEMATAMETETGMAMETATAILAPAGFCSSETATTERWGDPSGWAATTCC